MAQGMGSYIGLPSCGEFSSHTSTRNRVHGLGGHALRCIRKKRRAVGAFSVPQLMKMTHSIVAFAKNFLTVIMYTFHKFFTLRLGLHSFS